MTSTPRNLTAPIGDTLRSARLLSGLGVLFAWSYWPTLTGLAGLWNSDPTYSHGFLVPFVAAALIWHRRALPVKSESSRPRIGVLLIMSGIALRLVGARFYFEWLEWLSILPSLAGICSLCGGCLTWQRAWPGLAFLIFLLPLPYRLEVALAEPLRSVATSASTYLLQTLGFPAVAEGNVIVVGDVRLGVAEACSGLRMLVAFFATSAAVAGFVQRPAWERSLIVLSAVPIAVICNVARVTVTAALYETIGAEWAHRVFHDLAGWLMMPLALGLLGIERWMLSRLLIAPPERDVVPVGNGRLAMSARRNVAVIAPRDEPKILHDLDEAFGSSRGAVMATDKRNDPPLGEPGGVSPRTCAIAGNVRGLTASGSPARNSLEMVTQR